MADKDDITRRITVRKAVDEEEGAALSDGVPGPRAHEGVRGVREDAVQDIRTRLAEHIEALQFVNGAIGVCVNALLQQNADLDADIALVLRHTAGDKLFEATERLELVALALEYGDATEHCEEGETAAA